VQPKIFHTVARRHPSSREQKSGLPADDIPTSIAAGQNSELASALTTIADQAAIVNVMDMRRPIGRQTILDDLSRCALSPIASIVVNAVRTRDFERKIVEPHAN
jgi:hypothetical protein